MSSNQQTRNTELTYLAMHSHFCSILGQLVSDDLWGSLRNNDSDGSLQLTGTVCCSKTSIATGRTVELVTAFRSRLCADERSRQRGWTEAGGHTAISGREDGEGGRYESTANSSLQYRPLRMTPSRPLTL